MKATQTLIIAALCTLTATAAPPLQKVESQLSPHASVMLKQQREATVATDAIISAYITVDAQSFDAEALRREGVACNMMTPTIATARLPQSKLQKVATFPGVKYVQTGAATRQMLDVARPEVGAELVQSGEGLNNPYTGKGVIVGIVDSGFDYAHSAFRDADGHLRISRVWEQWPEPTEGTHSPERFGYGIELATEADILNSAADIYNNSHGSHVASIAAGADSYMDYTLRGMAPDAEIVLVSMVNAGASNVNISDAVAYIFDYADAVNKPCVINLSLGSNKGPHDGTSSFDAIADALQGPGRLIIGASGNHTGNTYHVNKQWAEGDNTPLRTFLDYTHTPSDKNRGGETEIWVSPELDVEVALLAYKTSGTPSQAERVVIYPQETTGAMDVSLGRNISGTIAVATEVSPLNGKHHVLLTSQVTSIRTGYAIAIEVAPRSGEGQADIWTDISYHSLSSRNIDGFASPSGSTVCEIGGTAGRILTVGAYTTRSEYTALGDDKPSSLKETVGDLSSFSCYGPTADGRMKPQITAPGCYISAAVSSYDNSGTLVYSHHHQANGRDNFYGYMQGTSMATPMVTGIVATWLEANPDLTPEMLADIVQRTARNDQYTGQLTMGSNHWGYGKIDALAGLRESLAASMGSVVSDSHTVATLVGRTLVFREDVEQLNIGVYTMQGSTVLTGTYSVKAGSTMELDLPAGLYIVRCGNQTIKVAIKA